MIAYLSRALKRTVTRGPLDTARYSFHVVRNAVASTYIDLRYGGALSRDRLHINDHRPNFNPLMHTDWRVLRDVFQHVPITAADVLVDVGCGDGRVINFWLSQGLRNRIVGIEIDPATAENAARRYARYRNVQIICGDAADVAVTTGGTIFYMYNSFVGEPLQRFADAIRDSGAVLVLYNFTDMAPFADRPVRVIRSDRDELQYRAAVISTR